MWKGKVKVLVSQSCPTFCDPTDCSLPGSVGCLTREIFILTFLGKLGWPGEKN